MIHIKRSIDKKYYVTVVGVNGKTLSTSETLNSIISAWKNIVAQCDIFDEAHDVIVIDETKGGKIKYLLNAFTKVKHKVA